jgi:predicted HTH domain antitoxin
MGITIEVPDGLGLSDQELRMILAVKLCERRLITSGQGARMAGLPKQDFIRQPGTYEISLFQYDIDEGMDDVRNAGSSRH